MKTYTFADQDAPVSAHMQGLVKALSVWRGDLNRQREKAPNERQRQQLRGMVQAYDQIIDIIKDSNSI
jgi:hypothetical protein